MTTILSGLCLTDDQLRVLGPRVGVHDLPTVLAVPSRHPTIDQRDAAFKRATQELLSRNVIDEDAVDPQVASLLRAFQRPDRELAMRLVTPVGTVGVSAVRTGQLCVLARRVDDEITVREVGRRDELSDATTALLAELPPSKPAAIKPVGAPLQELSQRLFSGQDAWSSADRICALGADPHAAMLLGAALAARQAFAEIVYYALADDEGRVTRAPAAVAVLYTKRGRIIGAPSISPSGQLWSTLKSGSDHVFRQAIGQLVELCPHRWESS